MNIYDPSLEAGDEPAAVTAEHGSSTRRKRLVVQVAAVVLGLALAWVAGPASPFGYSRRVGMMVLAIVPLAAIIVIFCAATRDDA